MSMVSCSVWQHCVLDVHFTIFQVQGQSRFFSALGGSCEKLELEIVMAASREAQAQQQRHPLAPVSAEVPSQFEQAQHRLTHIPYQAWCPSCISHRARADRHERTGESHAGPVPTTSFDYFYTKSDGQSAQEEDPDTITALVVVDSHSGFVSCIALEKKSQLDHANREIIKFIQMLGCSEVILHCDNEPSILQLKCLILRTRQAMGLKTRELSAVAYDRQQLSRECCWPCQALGVFIDASGSWEIGH